MSSKSFETNHQWIRTSWIPTQQNDTAKQERMQSSPGLGARISRWESDARGSIPSKLIHEDDRTIRRLSIVPMMEKITTAITILVKIGVISLTLLIIRSPVSVEM